MSQTSRIAILKYKRGSRSARALQGRLSNVVGRNVLSIRHERVGLLKPTRVLINWGSSETLGHTRSTIINKPEAVAYASNKLDTFRRWSEHNIRCPKWTQSSEEAMGWLQDGGTVFARTVLNGHSGRGIVVMENPDAFINAPLYTGYIRKKKEFRVHVFGGEVLDVQEKRRRDGVESNMIRNHANGYVFCRQDIDEPHDLRALAVDAVAALALDFGAVDIVYNEWADQCYALEVNTAPGLEGTTLERYANKFKELVYG